MKLIPVSVTRSVGRQRLTLQKNAPNMMFVAGLAGTLVSTVLACRATLKVSPVLDKFKQDVENVKGLEDSEEYDTANVGKDLAWVYTHNSLDLIKLYSPAIVVGVASVSLLTKSHTTLLNRNASLSAAYAVVSEAYGAYRDRVREEVGEEKELDLYFGRKIVVSSDAEDEKPTEGYAVEAGRYSPYARFFDEGSVNFQKQAEMNRLFIQCNQNFANNLLNSRGHVFLNEVYDMLGLERSSAGAVVGWVRNSDRGDGYIDFAPFEAKNNLFINEVEPRILLDFNVDGVIYDLIEGA